MQSIDKLIDQVRAHGGRVDLEDGGLRLGLDSYAGAAEIPAALRRREREVIGFLAGRRQRGVLPPIERAVPGGKVGIASAQEPWADVNRVPLHEQWLPVVWKIEGQLDREAFRRSFLDLLAVHELLRARYVQGAQGLALRIAGVDAIRLPFLDLTPLPADRRELAIWKRMAPVYQKSSSLEDGVLKLQLFRTEDERHFLAGFLHHVAFDKRSQQIFLGELMGRYYGHLAGRPAPRIAAFQYADFVNWEQKWLTPAERALASAYWEYELSGVTPMRLPGASETGKSSRIGGLSFALSKELSTSFESFSRLMGVTPNIVLLTVLSVLLGHWAGRKDVLLGCHVHARPQAFEAVIGCFAQARPFHLSFADNPGFRTLLQRARSRLAAASDLRRPVPRDIADRSEFGRILVNFADRRPARPRQLAGAPRDTTTALNLVRPADIAGASGNGDPPRLPPLRAGMAYLPKRLQTDFGRDMHFGVEQSADGVTGRITFAADSFSQDAVTALASRLAVVMKAAIQAPDDGVLAILERIAPLEQGDAATGQFLTQ